MTSTTETEQANAGQELLGLLDMIEATRPALNADEVHNIRVAIKRTRAWLKLCRGLTGKTDAYQNTVENLRSLSDSLAGQRDRDVALETLAKLARKYPGKKARQLIDRFTQAFAQVQPLAQAEPALSVTIDAVRQGLTPFTRMVIPAAVEVDVVTRAWTKMCKLGAAALRTEVCADLHAWRRQVKTLTYQLAMTGVGKPEMKKLMTRLTRLGSKLGQMHDLCFLQIMIEDAVAQQPHATDLDPLYKRISKERKALLSGIRKHYQHVCKPPPSLMSNA